MFGSRKGDQDKRSTPEAGSEAQHEKRRFWRFGRKQAEEQAVDESAPATPMQDSSTESGPASTDPIAPTAPLDTTATAPAERHDESEEHSKETSGQRFLHRMKRGFGFKDKAESPESEGVAAESPAPVVPQKQATAPEPAITPKPAIAPEPTTPEPATRPAPTVEAKQPEPVAKVKPQEIKQQEIKPSTPVAPSPAPEIAASSLKQAAAADTGITAEAPVAVEEEQAQGRFFARMKRGLSKTRDGIVTLFIGKKEIDDDLLDDLETQLLMADVGVETTRQIMDDLTQRVQYKELDDADALIKALKDELAKVLEPANKPLYIPAEKKPYVILVVGVNGVGKTTSIGKLTKRLQNEGRKVMLAAGDTFRAAAVEQLQVWGERNNIPVVAQHTGADSASVIFDAMEAAKARGIDVLIADTAGRLHNKAHLMDELAKVKRVMAKLDADAPHEILLVVDAGTGQNALNQAKFFHESVGLTGMALTKLDGTAKGGIVFAMAKEMQLPIRFLGVGEGIDDLRPFQADQFVDALFDLEALQ